jgi:hypothetical protein
LKRLARSFVLPAALAWCGLIIGTSSTVILPHDFFAWVASHVFSDETTYRWFVVFWGYSWFAIVKGWHALEFAILFAFTLVCLDRTTRLEPRKNVVLSMAFCTLLAVSDEYHQTFVPGRGGTWTDVAIDWIGIVLAGLVAWVHGGQLIRGGSGATKAHSSISNT